MPTTVNEMSDAGGENFKNIWDDSDIEEKMQMVELGLECILTLHQLMMGMRVL